MTIADERYVSLTTFRRNGERKSTPVWIAPVGDEVGFTTGSDSWKLKRLRNDPRCELQPSDVRGAVREGANVATGRAREASAEEYARVTAAIEAKYGYQATVAGLAGRLMALVGRGDRSARTAVLITLD